VDAVGQHVMQMVEFALAITFRRINPVVNDPELVERGIDIDTGHHAYAFNYTVFIPTILATH
jgi:hypothetical protein